MHVELLYFDGCPNWQEPNGHLREGRIGADQVALRVVVTDVLDGRDVALSASDAVDVIAPPHLRADRDQLTTLGRAPPFFGLPRTLPE